MREVGTNGIDLLLLHISGEVKLRPEGMKCSPNLRPRGRNNEIDRNIPDCPDNDTPNAEHSKGTLASPLV